MRANTEARLAYTVESACEVTGLARTRIYRAIADGGLKTFKAGRRRMVSAKALESFITTLELESNGRAAA
ncbi:MAG: helix-turn-helix domain-containing protein [Dokdonella sp.]